MKTSYVLLHETEEIFAPILLQVLKNEGIVCSTKPVYGAGLTTSAGLAERLRIFVPSVWRLFKAISTSRAATP